MHFIPKNKIVIGKNVQKTNNVGYIPAQTLGGWASEAWNEFGWSTGIAVYQYSYDEDANYLSTYINTANFNGSPGTFVPSKAISPEFDNLSDDTKDEDLNLVDKGDSSRLMTSLIGMALLLIALVM